MSLTAEPRIKDRYRLERILSGGGERRTWLAIDEQTDEKVTLKALHFGQERQWQGIEPFEREASVLPQLDHPHIPKFLETFWLERPEGQYFCLVQRYVEGRSLSECIASGKRFERSQVIDLAVQLLEVLEYLHSLQPPMIHRDIKPDNLILEESGRIYLIDFGAAQAIGTSGQTLTAAGTYGYMAPEQFVGQAVPASDLYGLGATLLQLITGFSPANLCVSAGHLQLPENPALAGWLGSWLEKMVAPELNCRFADATTARLALQKSEPDSATVSFPQTPVSSMQHFMVTEDSAERLCIILPDPLIPVIGTMAVGILLGQVLSTILVWNLKDPLGEGNFLFLYLIPLCFFIGIPIALFLSDRRTKISVYGGECSIERKAWLLTLWQKKIPLNTQTQLQALGYKTTPLGRPILLRIVGDDPTQSANFKAYLEDNQLQWLQEQIALRGAQAKPTQLEK